MKCLRTALVIILFALLTSLSVNANEASFSNDIDTDVLLEALPEDARKWFHSSEITPEDIDPTALERLLQQASIIIGDELMKPARVLFVMISIILTSRLVSEFVPKTFRHTIQVIGIAGITAILIPPLLEMVALTHSTIQSVNAFLLAAIPVYVSLLIAIGRASVGSTYGTLTLTTANIMLALFSQIILPFSRMYLALSCTSVFISQDVKLVPDSLYKVMKWAITLAVSLFTGFLSLQTLIASGADAVTGKAIKMIASGSVPIVGGAFSDALSVISASTGTVKSGVGAFGILASITILLPVCLRMAVWICVCRAAELTADLYMVRDLSPLLNACSQFIKMLLAVLFSAGSVSVISAAILLCVRGSYE